MADKEKLKQEIQQLRCKMKHVWKLVGKNKYFKYFECGRCGKRKDKVLNYSSRSGLYNYDKEWVAGADREPDLSTRSRYY